MVGYLKAIGFEHQHERRRTTVCVLIRAVVVLAAVRDVENEAFAVSGDADPLDAVVRLKWRGRGRRWWWGQWAGERRSRGWGGRRRTHDGGGEGHRHRCRTTGWGSGRRRADGRDSGRRRWGKGRPGRRGHGRWRQPGDYG